MKTLGYLSTALALSAVACGSSPSEDAGQTQADLTILGPIDTAPIVTAPTVAPPPALTPPLYPVLDGGAQPTGVGMPALTLGKAVLEATPRPSFGANAISAQAALRSAAATPNAGPATGVVNAPYPYTWLANCGSFIDPAVDGTYLNTFEPADGRGSIGGIQVYDASCVDTSDTNSGDEGAAVGFPLSVPSNMPLGGSINILPSIDFVDSWDLSTSGHSLGFIDLAVYDETTGATVGGNGEKIWDATVSGLKALNGSTTDYWDIEIVPTPSCVPSIISSGSSNSVSPCYSDTLNMLPQGTEADWQVFDTPLQYSFVPVPGHEYLVWIWTAIASPHDPDNDYVVQGEAPTNQDSIITRSVSTTITYSPAPPAGPPVQTITGISPPYGGLGTVLTITGTGFSPSSPPIVEFGSSYATNVTCASSTVCYATAPSGQSEVAVMADFPPAAPLTAGYFAYVPTTAPACTITNAACGEVSFTCPTIANITQIYELQNSDGSWGAGQPVNGTQTLALKTANAQTVRFCNIGEGGIVCGAPTTFTPNLTGLITSCDGSCGTVSDGCGGTLSCGACTAPTTCNGRAPTTKCSVGWRCCGSDGWSCGVCE